MTTAGSWAPVPGDRPDAELLAKIRKVLALKTSPNKHEAAVAASMAHDLLEKHQLEMLDVLAAGSAQEDVGDFAATDIKLPWQRQLLRTLALENYCDTMFTVTGGREVNVPRHDGRRPYTRWQGVRREIIVGRPSNVNTVQAMYQFIVPQLERLCLSEYLDYKGTPLPERPICPKCHAMVNKSEWRKFFEGMDKRKPQYEPCWSCPNDCDAWAIDDPPSPYGPLLSSRAFRRNFMEGAATQIGRDLYEQRKEAERKAKPDAPAGPGLVRTASDLARFFRDENKAYIDRQYGVLERNRSKYKEETFVQERGRARGRDVAVRPRAGLGVTPSLGAGR